MLTARSMNTYTQRIKVHEAIIIRAPSLNVSSTCNEAIEIFLNNRKYHSLAIVSAGSPIAILARDEMLSQNERPFFAERFGHRPCISFSNKAPQIVEENESLNHLIGILTSDDQRHLKDGCIYTRDGRYLGIGLAEDLVRLVTDSRIEASKHLNSLTFLPGRVPTAECIESLIWGRVDFVVAHVDLSQFKSFNEYYGISLGDCAIELAARELDSKINRECDFLGHLGGDDFIVIFKSLDWYVRLNYAIDAFNENIKNLYDKDSFISGGINALNDEVSRWKSNFLRLNIGVVSVYDGKYSNAVEVLNAVESSLEKARTFGYDIYCEQEELCVPSIDHFKRKQRYVTTRVELRNHA